MFTKISCLLLLVATFNVARCFEVHRHMTKRDLRAVFHTDDVSKLPEYELVPMHHIQTNQTHAEINIRGERFKRDLRLKAIDSVLFGKSTKVWRAVFSRSTNRIEYIPIENALDRAVALQDRHKRAALMMFTDEHNNAYYDGTIGSQHVLRPLPSSTLHRLSRNRDYQNHKNTQCQNSENCIFHHVVIKTNVKSDFHDRDSFPWRDHHTPHFHGFGAVDDPFFTLPSFPLPGFHSHDPSPEVDSGGSVSKYIDDFFKLFGRPTTDPVVNAPVIITRFGNDRDKTPGGGRLKPEVAITTTIPPRIIETTTRRFNQEPRDETNNDNSKTVYPKILVVVDSRLYRVIGSHVIKTLKYVMSFMNGVDLRFKDLEDPKVKLHVAGVIIAQNQNATPYEDISRYITNTEGEPVVNAGTTINKMRDYFERRNYFSEKMSKSMKFDVVLVLTGFDICTKNYDGSCSLTTIGIANIGALCSNVEYGRPGSSLVEDTGKYQGILTAVHELGHMFGVHHDSENNGAQCNKEDGFLMSPQVSVTSNQYFWSRCSQNAMKYYFNTRWGSCARERPEAGKTYPLDHLPGKNFSLDEQCRAFFRQQYPEASACPKSERDICSGISCKKRQEDSCWRTYPAAEGTVCGENMHCITGKCVPMTNHQRQHIQG